MTNEKLIHKRKIFFFSKFKSTIFTWCFIVIPNSCSWLQLFMKILLIIKIKLSHDENFFNLILQSCFPKIWGNYCKLLKAINLNFQLLRLERRCELHEREIATLNFKDWEIATLNVKDRETATLNFLNMKAATLNACRLQL